MKKKIVIAIDGPAASGKSTTAKLLAAKLGYIYVDTGAMYRAVTYKALSENVLDLLINDEKFLHDFINSTEVTLTESSVFLDCKDVTNEIRNNDVSKSVSKVSALKPIRDKLSQYQKDLGEEKGVVMDGRDIGTVIFPNAELKIYMLASAKERAKRRFEEIKVKQPDSSVSIETLESEIVKRDEEDMNREVSPLRKADNAIELDTSYLSIDEQVDKIYQFAIQLIEGKN